MIVVVGVEGSPVSVEVLEKAAKQARWRDAELHIVHVSQMPIVYSEVPIDLTGIAESERVAVWEQLEPTVSAIDVPTKRIDLQGYAPDLLPDYAHRVGADLVVVGTRGRGDFASLILGSTSHRTIQVAGCDVLVVNPTAD
ncbi:MAG: universal stress protein [Acidimicrobiia bacterium]